MRFLCRGETKLFDAVPNLVAIEAEQCAGTYYDETRAASRGGAEHIVVPQAVARGWDHVRQEGKMVDTCPACKAAMQQNDA